MTLLDSVTLEEEVVGGTVSGLVSLEMLEEALSAAELEEISCGTLKGSELFTKVKTKITIRWFFVLWTRRLRSPLA